MGPSSITSTFWWAFKSQHRAIFFRNPYLLKWVKEKQSRNIDPLDVPIAKWVAFLREHNATKKYVDKNIEIARAQIARLRLMSEMLGESKASEDELNREISKIVRVFYLRET